MKGAKGLSDFLENSIPANAVVKGNSENRDVKENGSSNGKYDDDVEVIGGIEENTLEKTEIKNEQFDSQMDRLASNSLDC